MFFLQIAGSVVALARALVQGNIVYRIHFCLQSLTDLASCFHCLQIHYQRAMVDRKGRESLVGSGVQDLQIRLRSIWCVCPGERPRWTPQDMKFLLCPAFLAAKLTAP